MEHYDYEAVN